MKRRYSIVTLLVCGVFSIATAQSNTSTVPEPFRGFDANSKLVIDYTDLDSLLDMVVLDTGRSTRAKADPNHAKTGTRMKAKVNLYTISEGNRFYYEIFKDNDQNQQTLANIRARLESIPSVVPLEKFSRDEQLAYWLNLYNITVIGEIARVYPTNDLRKILTGKKSFLSRKLLNVAGVELSLDDIQYTILKQNYNSSPLVIYGLYQGNIGGPSIRKTAYTGKYVYADLIDNAMEFINSNRGTMSKNDRVFRVSSLYDHNRDFFTDFNSDLTSHLLEYLEGKQRGQLSAATVIEADVVDWTVTDLFGSQREIGGSLTHSNAAMMGAVSGSSTAMINTAASTSGSRYSPAVMERLNNLNRKKSTESGSDADSVNSSGSTKSPTATEDAEHPEKVNQ